MEATIKIGIAEDNHLIHDSLCKDIKKMEGFELLVAAHNGKELMEQLLNNKPDIILMDINMPIMNGLEALFQIKRLYPEIKVLMFSSEHKREFIKEVMDLGAVGFLYKQALPPQIEEALREVYSKGFYHDDLVKAAMGLPKDV